MSLETRRHIEGSPGNEGSVVLPDPYNATTFITETDTFAAGLARCDARETVGFMYFALRWTFVIKP